MLFINKVDFILFFFKKTFNLGLNKEVVLLYLS